MGRRTRQEVTDDIETTLAQLLSGNLANVRIICDAGSIPHVEVTGLLIGDADYARAEELMKLLKEYGGSVRKEGSNA